MVAGTEVAAGVVAALALRVILRWLGQRAQRTQWSGDDLIVNLLRWVMPLTAAIAGVWLAVLGLPLSTGWRNNADHLLLASVVLAVTFGVARVASAVVHSGLLPHSRASGSATIFVNITRIVVFAIGALILLNSLGVAITPLLTALGVGGLAVALALQDTLTNLFAGIHILASGKVEAGDFVRLDTGVEGTIVDTNWRNTIIRQLSNNLIIVPNATLASCILTNYHQPDRESSVSVQVGVSYDSDLEHVEKVTLEVGREVMRTVEGGVPSHDPNVRFNTFGDSGITFSVGLRTTEATGRYLITHEFIKRLHRRYQAEGIEMPTSGVTIIQAPSHA